MDKTEYTFDDFIAEVHPEYKDFAQTTNEALLGEGYKLKIESKANGFAVSYSHPKSKRSVLNFIFRKKALVARIYADHLRNYSDFLNRLPESMEKEIAKACVCKRLISPEDCNPRCVMGYDFSVRGNHYQKCRYNCFQFVVAEESRPFLSEFIELERRERATG